VDYTPAKNDAHQTQWQLIYRIGAIAMCIMLLLIILDMIVSMVTPADAPLPMTLTTQDWLNLFATNPLQAFRDLGILNILNNLLSIPVFIALYGCHRHNQHPLALLALFTFVMGAVIYISNNTVLPLYALSRDYAVATDSEKAVILSAGHALLARGEDFTMGTLVGFIVPSVGNMLMAVVVVSGGVFRKVTGYVGLLGFTLLLVFTLIVTVAPSSFSTAMLLAMPGGIFVLVWNVLIARRLFQLSTKSGYSSGTSA